MDNERQPIVEVSGATVRFQAETALDNVDFRMFAGEVHSLMGENGAGKSTLIKALTGAIRLDAGEIRLDGEKVRFRSPLDAQRAGIGTVYQEIELLPNLSVGENIMLGREPRRLGVIDWAAVRDVAHTALLDLGLDVDPASLLGGHSLAVQQLVAIARALAMDAKVLVLDEPTSSLDVDETAELFRVIRELKSRGVAILFVSHFLDQVYEICDRITVLRGGTVIGEFLTRELLRINLVKKMLGRDPGELPSRSTSLVTGEPTVAVSATDISAKPGLSNATVELVEGEVLGVAGLLGSGRTELARAVTGIDRIDSGAIIVYGGSKSMKNPREAIALGVVYSSENRRSEGLIDRLSVMDNITLAIQAQLGVFKRMSRARQRELATSWVEALGIRPADLDRPVAHLSGGNQQKVMLARLLALSPRVLVLDEPTRGIDVGAKVDVQNLVGDLADNGIAVVYISAEFEEVLRVGHRIAIMRNGVLVETLPSTDLTFDSLLAIVSKPDGTEE